MNWQWSRLWVTCPVNIVKKYEVREKYNKIVLFQVLSIVDSTVAARRSFADMKIEFPALAQLPINKWAGVGAVWWVLSSSIEISNCSEKVDFYNTQRIRSSPSPLAPERHELRTKCICTAYNLKIHITCSSDLWIVFQPIHLLNIFLSSYIPTIVKETNPDEWNEKQRQQVSMLNMELVHSLRSVDSAFSSGESALWVFQSVTFHY